MNETDDYIGIENYHRNHFSERSNLFKMDPSKSERFVDTRLSSSKSSDLAMPSNCSKLFQVPFSWSDNRSSKSEKLLSSFFKFTSFLYTSSRIFYDRNPSFIIFTKENAIC